MARSLVNTIREGRPGTPGERLRINAWDSVLIKSFSCVILFESFHFAARAERAARNVWPLRCAAHAARAARAVREACGACGVLRLRRVRRAARSALAARAAQVAACAGSSGVHCAQRSKEMAYW